jgi:pimeloyl-ACP methyl ester carboxylesterase
MLSALLLLLPAGTQAAGVTVITHGWQGETTTWINAMANAIEDRIGGVLSAARYTLVIDDDNLLLEPRISSFTKDASSLPLASVGSGEIIVKVDWSDLDGGVPCFNSISTRWIAPLIVQALTQPNAATDGTLSRPLAELPIHLIGHSRGGSLVAEVARELGTSGIWVDQLTTLDPHPLSCPLGGSDAPTDLFPA